MGKKIVKAGMKFEVAENIHGLLILSYTGEESSPIHQYYSWTCHDEEEVADMIEACIDPERNPQREWFVRHMDELNIKW